LIKRVSEDITTVEKIFHTKCHKKHEKYEAAQLDNMFMFLEQHIRMISEGSCDTEDWSNDAENSALIIGIHYITKENSCF